MEKVLLVGDVEVITQLESGLAKEYKVYQATGTTQALELLLRHAPKVVLLDIGLRVASRSDLPGQDPADAFRCLRSMVERRPGTKIVVLTGSEQREAGYRALECGAYDFQQKPIDLAQLKIVIARAAHLSSIEEQRCQLQEALVRSTESLEGIADQCAAMRKLFNAMQTLEGQEPVSEQAGFEDEAAGAMPGLASAEGSYCDPKGAGEGSERHDRGGAPLVADLALQTEHLTLREVRDRVEKGMITTAVGNCGGNMVRASELLGVSRPALYDLMKKHGLFRPGVRH